MRKRPRCWWVKTHEDAIIQRVVYANRSAGLGLTNAYTVHGGLIARIQRTGFTRRALGQIGAAACPVRRGPRDEGAGALDAAGSQVGRARISARAGGIGRAREGGVVRGGIWGTNRGVGTTAGTAAAVVADADAVTVLGARVGVGSCRARAREATVCIGRKPRWARCRHVARDGRALKDALAEIACGTHRAAADGWNTIDVTTRLRRRGGRGHRIRRAVAASRARRHAVAVERALARRWGASGVFVAINVEGVVFLGRPTKPRRTARAERDQEGSQGETHGGQDSSRDCADCNPV